MLFECGSGHVWETTPHIIKRGHWCPVCARVKRLTIKDMETLAKKRGGRCLSNVYINANSKLKWQCSEGHIWHTKPNVIQQGRWCPICRIEISPISAHINPYKLNKTKVTPSF